MYAQLFLSADLSKPNMYLHDLFTFAWLCFSAIDLLVTVAWKLARNEFFPFLFWSCVEFAAADVEFFFTAWYVLAYFRCDNHISSFVVYK